MTECDMSIYGLLIIIFVLTVGFLYALIAYRSEAIRAYLLLSKYQNFEQLETMRKRESDDSW